LLLGKLCRVSRSLVDEVSIYTFIFERSINLQLVTKFLYSKKLAKNKKFLYSKWKSRNTILSNWFL